MDTASAHLGQVARQVAKTKDALRTNAKDWSPCSLESAADEIDKEESQKSHDNQQKAHYKDYD